MGLILFGAAIVACGGDGASSGTSDDEMTADGDVRLGADGLPVGPDGKPLPTKLDGRYELASSFDLTSANILPDTLNTSLKALSSFKEAPSATLVSLLDAANVPLIPNVVNALPGPLKDYLLGSIDEHVFKSVYEAVPVTERLTSLLDDLASIVTKFDVISTLDLPAGDGIGNAKAKHLFAGVGWTWAGKRHIIRAPDVIGTVAQTSAETNAVALEKRSPELESGRLKLDSHTFAIPLGTFAVKAIDDLATAKLDASGAGLRGALGALINCEALADDVSNRCINPTVGPCVGHRDEIRDVCSMGLDLVVQSVKDAIKTLDIPVLSLDEGFAQMWDAPTTKGKLDARIDRIDHGFWNAKIKVTKEARPIIATFEGHRLGDAASGSPR